MVSSVDISMQHMVQPALCDELWVLCFHRFHLDRILFVVGVDVNALVYFAEGPLVDLFADTIFATDVFHAWLLFIQHSASQPFSVFERFFTHPYL